MSSSCLVGDINLIPWDHLDDPVQCKVKTRYRQPEQPAIIEQIGENRIRVTFQEPQRAVTPGQAAVFMTGIRYLAEEPYWRRMPEHIKHTLFHNNKNLRFQDAFSLKSEIFIFIMLFRTSGYLLLYFCRMKIQSVLLPAAYRLPLYLPAVPRLQTALWTDGPV